MKKCIIGLFLAIICVFSVERLNVSASEDYTQGGEITGCVIDINKDNILNVNSGTLTLEDVSFTKSYANSLTKIITVGENATVILNDVDFTGISGSVAIENKGKLILNKVTFGKGFVSSIKINSDVENSTVLNGSVSINSIEITKGYITVNDNTVIESVINLSFTNTPDVGKRVVTGDNSIASYYMDKFLFVGGNKLYIDYVGDDYSSLSEDCKSSDTLVAGDIIVTQEFARYKDENFIYFAGRYCTANNYLTSEMVARTVTGQGHTNKYLDNITSFSTSTTNTYANYNSALIEDADDVKVNLKVKSGESVLSTLETINIYAGMKWGVFVDIPNEYSYKNISLSGGSKCTASVTFSNSKFARVLIDGSACENAETLNIDIQVEKEIKQDINVDILMDNYTQEYSNVDFKTSLKPYYIFEEEKVYVEYTLLNGGVECNECKNVGEYVVNITSAEPTGIKFNNTTLNFEITAKAVSVSPSDFEFTYGEEVVLSENVDIIETGESITVTYVKESGINVGVYDIESVSCGNGNYVVTLEDGEDKVEIIPLEISISYTQNTFRYDGSQKEMTVSLEGVLSGDTVNLLLVSANANITGNKITATTVGTYVVNISLDNANYVLNNSSKSVTMTISKGIYDNSNLELEKSSFEVDSDVNLTFKDIPSFITFAYSKSFIVPNNYPVTITFELEENDLYDELSITSKVYTIEITKKDISMTHLTLVGDREVMYDGKVHTLLLNGTLPDGVTISSIENESNIHQGTYEVKYNFSWDVDKYNCISFISDTLVIRPIELNIELTEREYVYTGSPITPQISVSGILLEDDIEVVAKSNTNVGQYALEITINNNDYGDYVYSVNDYYFITKKTINLQNIHLVKDEVVYNGKLVIPEIDGDLPEGILNFKLVHTAIKDVGEYTVTAEIEVGSNYSRPTWSSKITVVPKSITVIFSDYENIVEDGTLKSISVKLNGVLESNFESYEVTYEPKPIASGSYICTVKLVGKTNYVLVGERSKEFTIYPSKKVYSNNDMSVTVQGNGGNLSNLEVTCTTDDKLVEYSLKSVSTRIAGYNVINFSGDEKEVSVSLDTNLNVSNVENIKVFKYSDGMLTEIDFDIKNGKISFEGDSGYSYVVLEESTTNTTLIIIIIALSVLLVSVFVVLTIFIVKRKNKRL